MNSTNRQERNYRVLLMSIGDHTEDKRDAFCRAISDKYSISFDLLRQIVDRSPVILKKNLSKKKAEAFAKVLRSYGASAAVEERKDSPPIFLEFQDMTHSRVALISSHFFRTRGGQWNLLGRVKNLSKDDLADIWVLVQVFDRQGEILAFEESPLPINPLPPDGFSPFKVILDSSLTIRSLSIAFKNSSGASIPVADRRKRKEWVEVETGAEDRECISRPSLSQFFTDVRDSETQDRILAESSFFAPQEDPTVPNEEEIGTLKAELEAAESGIDLILTEEDESLPAPIDTPLFEDAWLLSRDHPDPGRTVESKTADPEVILPETGETKAEEKEVSPSFLWLEDFRKSVLAYSEKDRDVFSEWFKEIQRENGFESPFHALLTILVHARFDPFSQAEKAFRNTQKIYRLIAQPGLDKESIPLLEGTSFSTDEQWKDLFYRAIPKLQQTGRQIIEKKHRNALELGKLVEIVPHMNDRNSRKAIRQMKDLIPELIGIDFYNVRVSIRGSLYRVASRLGIVDPYFDIYHGPHSIGDLKIQSFAKAAFPDDPGRVEDPMEWTGSKTEEGGHCFPIQPQCSGCLFETFCPKLHLLIDPAEKGILS